MVNCDLNKVSPTAMAWSPPEKNISQPQPVNKAVSSEISYYDADVDDDEDLIEEDEEDARQAAAVEKVKEWLEVRHYSLDDLAEVEDVADFDEKVLERCRKRPRGILQAITKLDLGSSWKGSGKFHKGEPRKIKNKIKESENDENPLFKQQGIESTSKHCTTAVSVPVPPCQENDVPVPPCQENDAPVPPCQEKDVPGPPLTSKDDQTNINIETGEEIFEEVSILVNGFENIIDDPEENPDPVYLGEPTKTDLISHKSDNNLLAADVCPDTLKAESHCGNELRHMNNTMERFEASVSAFWAVIPED